MEKEEFVESMGRYRLLLYHIAWTMLHVPEDVEDAMQETALHAWARRDTLRDRESFRPWAARIMVNECTNILRKRKRQALSEKACALNTVASDTGASLAVQGLPEKERLPLVLFYLEGMEAKEIAEVLHVPVTTVRGRIHRAKMHLRKELTE